MNTTYSLSLTKRARSSLRSIYDYIRDVLSNETAAKKMVSKLLQGMESLKTFPEAGFNADQRYGKRINDTFETRALVVKRYVILYFIDESRKEIVVSHIFSSKSDYIKLLKKLRLVVRKSPTGESTYYFFVMINCLALREQYIPLPEGMPFLCPNLDTHPYLRTNML